VEIKKKFLLLLPPPDEERLGELEIKKRLDRGVLICYLKRAFLGGGKTRISYRVKQGGHFG
jgi:hypothetical protein